MNYPIDSREFEYEGHKFKVTAYRDDDMCEPWKEHDGHGIVSDWTTRDKRPGELVLAEGTRGREKRFYDFQATVKIARKDGWGFLPWKLETTQRNDLWHASAGPIICIHEGINQAIRGVYATHRATMTAKQYAVGATMKDFENLRAWCNDEWCWVWIEVQLLDDSGDEMDIDGATETLCGIESYGDYWHDDCARELASDILHNLQHELAA